MKSPSLRSIETATGIALVIGAVALHVYNFMSAGALWRDEANTVALVTQPTLGEVFRHLQFDSFPMVWPAIVRVLVAAFGAMNDTALRATGLVIGLLAASSLWLVPRRKSESIPLIALALFAIHPSVIRWGDSLRAYGLGLALAIAICAMFARFVASGDRKHFALALFFSVIGAQTLYYNAVVILACCAGGAVACAMAREWRRLVATGCIGFIAALSLLPYASTMRAASTWNSSVRIPYYDLAWFLAKVIETLKPAGPLSFPFWVVAVCLAVWAGLKESSGRRIPLDREERILTVFAASTLGIGVIAHFVFLRTLAYVTSAWYYMSLLALSVACVEIVSSMLVRSAAARVFRLTAVGLLAVSTFVFAPVLLGSRMTNADTIAHRLDASATSRDLIVVNPWYAGVTFGRYYTGDAQWMMLPSMKYEGYHRYDFLVSQMQQRDQRAPVEPIIDAASRVLKNGGTVYLVGRVPPPSADVLPPANIPRDGWKSTLYQEQWAGMLSEHLKQHAGEVKTLPMDSTQRVSQLERLGVATARGWRD